MRHGGPFLLLPWAIVALGLATPPGTAAETAASPPPHVRRGETVDARYQGYRGELQAVHERLATVVRTHAPGLLPKLAPPEPVPHGYRIRPRVVPDAPVPAERPRARSARYSWPWTEELIRREVKKIEDLAGRLGRLADSGGDYEKLVAEYAQLLERQAIIDAHIEYNRLWQQEIAAHRRGYDRQTALHDAVLARQAIGDALNASDEAAFLEALRAVPRVDSAAPADIVRTTLREREGALARDIHAATHRLTPQVRLRVERSGPHRWVVRVVLHTDLEDPSFVRTFKSAVEQVWHVRDGDDEFAVELSIATLPAALLYARGPQCGGAPPPCRPPGPGEPIDLQGHLARFPPGHAVLTTGADSTHVRAGRAIVLGPHDIAPHVLAHEFGHILGFPDAYFRGYRDLGADGYLVMEVSADPDDIMGAPGTGSVRRHHFEAILAVGGPAAGQTRGDLDAPLGQ